MALKKPPRNPGKYGPGVLDPDEYEAAQAVVDSGQNKYGPGVIDDHPDNETEESQTEDSPDNEAPEKTELDEMIEKYASSDGYLSIKDLKGLLEEMPSAFDRVFSWELNRADGARVGALQHLQKIEEGTESPRVLVVKAIESAIKKARGE